MKTVKLNYWLCISHITKIAGVNPSTNEILVDSNGRRVGLVNETISIDTSLMLDRIAEAIFGLYNTYEKNRMGLLKKHNLENKDLTEEEIKKLSDEFSEMANVELEVSFYPIKVEQIGKIVSEENYITVSKLICE